MAAALSRYDFVLLLRLNASSSLRFPPEDVKQQIAQAASSARKRLLVYLPSTPLWKTLAASRQASFDDVQTFLSKTYVLAGSALDEDVGVDIVIEVLRGEEDILLDATNATALQEAGKQHGWTAPASASDQDSEDASNLDLHTAKDEDMGTVALGGTFDHLHAGHQILLTMACWIAQRRVIVGVTDDVLLGNKSDRDLLESLEQRTQAVRSFLSLVCPTLQHDTPALQDVYGPTAHDPDVQGVLVSEETRKGAASIAEIRQQKALSSLKLFVIKVISAENVLGADISKEDMAKSKMGSTAIRARLRKRMEAESAVSHP